jgi:hypothetical protein
MAVRGVLVESSLLEGSSSVEKLLYRLGLSNLHVVSSSVSLSLALLALFRKHFRSLRAPW